MRSWGAGSSIMEAWGRGGRTTLHSLYSSPRRSILELPRTVALYQSPSPAVTPPPHLGLMGRGVGASIACCFYITSALPPQTKTLLQLPSRLQLQLLPAAAAAAAAAACQA